MLNNLSSLVVDVSRYQLKIKPALMRSNGVGLTIIKASGGITPDPRFPQHYEDCQRDEMDVAVYHWVDPIYTPQRQIDVLLKTIAGKNVKAVFLDLEQWWNNWGSWAQAIAQKISWTAVTRIRPDLLAKHAYQTADYLLSNTSIPGGLYTSYGFVTSYAPAMAEWIGKMGLWVACYIIKSPVKISTTWDVLKNIYMPKNTAPLLLPPGADPERVVGWQYSGDLISVPGMYADLNATRLSPADLSIFDPVWLKNLTGKELPAVLPPVLPPVEKYVVSKWVTRGLNMRQGPATTYPAITTLRAGSVLIYVGVKNGDWLRVDYNGTLGWVHSAYVTKL